MNSWQLRPGGYRGPLSLTSAAKVREWPEQANVFSLPASREVCAYATATCWQGCYAKRGRMAFPTPQSAFLRNYNALKATRSVQGMAELLIELLDWMKFSLFRIHVGGDFFSPADAQAWAAACRETGSARFWAYTRSRDMAVLDTLRKVSNLQLLLSCDRDNWRQMLALSREFPEFGLSCYSVGEVPPVAVYDRGKEVPETNPSGLIVFSDPSVQRKLALPGTCPTRQARDPWPKEGACIKCRRCCGLLPRN
jgi:hypothetical protein